MARTVDQLARDLFAPILQARTFPDGWHVIGWDAEQGLALTLGRGTTVLLIELEARDESIPCYARTKQFNVCARLQLEACEMTDVDRRVVDKVVALVARREALLPVLERSEPSRRAVVREITVDRVLMPEGGGNYYLNPYVGCMIGCEFCYVGPRAALSRRLGGLAEVPWGRYVDVKINAAEILREEVRQRPAGLVRMSPILTDPYQPLEARYRITRQCLEVLHDAGFTPVILTRAARVLDDLDLLVRFPRAAVGFSIPTDDDAMRAHFEPGSDAIEDRFEALEKCHRAGVRTFGCVQPLLPMNVENLVGRMAPFITAVRLDRMHFVPRMLHRYEAAGRVDASSDEFFARTTAELTREFRARGVSVDALDDLVSLLA
jgi:DNA repair photolyase